MNNYSITQRVLHRIALSSNFLKKIYFDYEKTFFLKQSNIIDDNHVFIAGMARSGTTSILSAIYSTEEFASLTYKDMPFILCPNLWSKLNTKGITINKQQRAHNDGIDIDTSSPEAFEEVFWKTFDCNDLETNIEFTNFIKLLCFKYKRNRYLSKNNQNIKRIDYLNKNYPLSRIIIPFRNPLQQAFSLYNQHEHFLGLQRQDRFIKNYMFWIGHSEFGIDYKPITNENLEFDNYKELDHWLEQWFHLYQNLYYHKSNDKVLFVCYEDLCNDDRTWKSILSFININNFRNFNFKESVKEIQLPYNSDLYNECISVYKRLKDQ